MRPILTHMGEVVPLAEVVGTGTGAPVSVNGLFMRPYQAADLGVPSVIGSNPYFAYMAADYPVFGTGTRLTRSGTIYRRKVLQPDEVSGINVVELVKL